MTLSEPQIQSTVPFYRRRWFIWTVGALVLTFIVAAIAVYAVFSLWRSSPEHALIDAVQYALKTPGSYHVVTADADMTVVMNNQHYRLTGTVKDIPLDTVLIDNTIYVKSSQPEKLYALLVGTSQINSQLQTMIRAVVASVKDKWIAIGFSQTQQTKTAQCLAQSRSAPTDDPATWGQVYGAYSAHRFTQIDAVQNKPATYAVTVDGNVLTHFIAALRQTEFYQLLATCSGMDKNIPDSIKGSYRATVTLEQSEHVLRSVTTGSGASKVAITASYTDIPTIAAPMNATRIDQLILSYFQSAGRQLFSAGTLAQ